MSMLVVKLKKSTIGISKKQKEAIRCIGLRKINQIKKIKDNAANRGQVFSVQHLVEVYVESVK